MNNVPQKLRNQWNKEDAAGIIRVCARASEGNCQGRLTKEHAIIYAAKQLQEDWSILDICAFHHSVDNFQGGKGMNKEKHIWLALCRAPEGRLKELSRAVDYIALKVRLDKIYDKKNN